MNEYDLLLKAIRTAGIGFIKHPKIKVILCLNILSLKTRIYHLLIVIEVFRSRIGANLPREYLKCNRKN